MTTAKVKDSWAWMALYGGSMALMGSYMAMLKLQDEPARPTPDARFEQVLAEGAWYTMMMSNDLPFFTEECGQYQIDDDMFYARWFNTKTQRVGNMDAGFRCSNWNAGDCQLEISPGMWSIGSFQFAFVDYEDFFVAYSVADMAGISFMESVWIGSRTAYKQGTDEFVDFKDRVSLVMDALMPTYPMSKLGVVKHTDQCEYTLPYQGWEPKIKKQTKKTEAEEDTPL